MLIVATALAFGHWMTESGAPAGLVRLAMSHDFATWQFLLLINLLLLVLGCFLEVTATLLLVLPILAPALKPLGVDPVLDHLHPQHGDRPGAPAGGPQSLRPRDHLCGAGRRGDPRHTAVSDPAADRAGHHHLRADPDPVVAGSGVRQVRGVVRAPK